ncbi:MAG: NUDIX hydrolase [Chloroflexota bacterium]
MHTWEYEGRTITFSWLGDVDIEPMRAYALAFTEDGQMLLVGDGQGEFEYWLPGGGIEAGETPEEALRRELMEEAAATIQAHKRIGIQRGHDPLMGTEHQVFYWCRISLASEFVPETEVTERRLVSPSEFLDRLFWGRKDPKAKMLLQQAIELDQQYEKQNHNAVDSNSGAFNGSA